MVFKMDVFTIIAIIEMSFGAMRLCVEYILLAVRSLLVGVLVGLINLGFRACRLVGIRRSSRVSLDMSGR